MLKSALKVNLGRQLANDSNTLHPIGHWHTFVQPHTSRRLSLPSDPPLAISGIASKFAEIVHGKYCTGLWRSHITQNFAPAFPSVLALRLSEYQSPQWSRAAIDSAVNFLHHNLYMPTVDLITTGVCRNAFEEEFVNLTSNFYSYTS